MIDIKINKIIQENKLSQYLEKNGYKIDKSKSTKKYIKYKNNDDIIILMYNKYEDVEYYFNPRDSEDKGNIINFVAYRNGKNYKEAIKILDLSYNLYNNDEISIFKKQNKNIEKNLNELLKDYKLYDFNVKNDNYLNAERLISKKILNQQQFQNSIKHNRYKNFSHYNTFFLYFDKNNDVCGYQNNYNNGKVYHLGLRGNGLWGNLINKNEVVKSVILFESVIDSLSYHEMFNKEKNNIKYFACGGTISKNQINLVLNYCEKNNVKLNVGFDNDLGGVKNSFRLIKFIMSKSNNENNFNIDNINNMNEFEKKFNEIKYNENMNLKFIDFKFPKEIGKDWNDILREKKGKEKSKRISFSINHF